jgi:hypothetical protein
MGGKTRLGMFSSELDDTDAPNVRRFKSVDAPHEFLILNNVHANLYESW